MSARADTITCPSVADKLPEIPAAAQAEVDRNLALLNTQIAEANKRLVTSAGEGGPNFVQNAILGPLADKRTATINRIATAIGRVAARPELSVATLSTCKLGSGGGTATETPAPEASASATPGTSDAPAPEGTAKTITCPSVADKLPEIPAAAKAEIDRNLALLDTQIAEANKRLITSAGEGGPNFIQNAILGPLADKRTATINRMATAIGRVAARPNLPVEALSTCKLSSGGATATATAAPESPTSPPSDEATTAPPSTGSKKITCPSVADKLPEIPAAAKAEIDRNLALLDTQIAEANKRLVTSAGEGGPNFIQNAILGPLADKRTATINRMATAIGRVAARPNLPVEALSTCKLSSASASSGAARTAGPSADDFIDIQAVSPVQQPKLTESSGTFVSKCGTGQESHTNSDNVITAPGVSNGAQHVNNYVGNESTDAFSTNESLAAADTTCRFSADQSTYFWPALQVLTGGKSTSVLPSAVQLQFRGNAVSRVTAAPRFLRLVTGDAMAVTNSAADAPADTSTDAPTDAPSDLPTDVPTDLPTDLPTDVPTDLPTDTATDAPADAPTDAQTDAPTDAPAAGADNARPTFSCTGFTDRLTDKYPICPDGSSVVRILDMPSCWDGQNLDSADHRTHVVFPDESGACPSGTKAVPQLRMTLVYANVPNTQPEGTNVPFALDGVASQQQSPNTDHAGAIEVMSRQLMKTVVRCINTGRRC
ncbi:DUF1996 domain-containing protein [Nonomuraea guangzhouensis]|uniref:DUF1996 domain-containing protein n=1 Tax=Nonomuraea guangzhouensis TaxID=1291555 RepID=A0ABW4G815_9ACTN|nr:DUF1996 domain-containing protein [Nonomuraea guangzhouensis]